MAKHLVDVGGGADFLEGLVPLLSSHRSYRSLRTISPLLIHISPPLDLSLHQGCF